MIPCQGCWTVYRIDLPDSSGETLSICWPRSETYKSRRMPTGATVKRWPGGVIRLRQGARVIEDCRRTRLHLGLTRAAKAGVRDIQAQRQQR